jgi:hypothetical protein
MNFTAMRINYNSYNQILFIFMFSDLRRTKEKEN